MTNSRNHLIVVILLALPMSSWAGQVCVHDAGAATPAAADAPAKAHHGEHGTAVHDRLSQASADNATDAPFAPQSGDGCPCADGCSNSCMISACSAAALTSRPADAPRAADGPLYVLASALHDNPLPAPLFRPPIARS